MGRLRSCFKFGWPLVAGLIVVTIGLAIFAGLAIRVVQDNALWFDDAILTWLAQIASPALTTFALIVTYTASQWVLIPVLLLLLLLWWRHRRAAWIALVVSVVGIGAINQFIKTLFERARPTLVPALMHETGYSFPSGHSQAAVGFYGVLAYLIARRLAPRWRLPVYFAAVIWIVMVGLSRNYLEVHYPSDVLAAYAVTVPWILAVIFVHQCYAPPVAGEEKVIKPAPGAPPAPEHSDKG